MPGLMRMGVAGVKKYDQIYVMNLCLSSSEATPPILGV